MEMEMEMERDGGVGGMDGCMDGSRDKWERCTEVGESLSIHSLGLWVLRDEA